MNIECSGSIFGTDNSREWNGLISIFDFSNLMIWDLVSMHVFSLQIHRGTVWDLASLGLIVSENAKKNKQLF